MGSVVGERFVRGVNICLEHHIPFICFAASGGARMQESLFSLMQMAKTSAALGRMAQQGVPLHIGVNRPYNGWCLGQFCYAGRYQYCRTQGPDRIRRSEGDRADSTGKAA